MNAYSDIDIWIRRMMILLGFIVVTSALGALILVVFLYQSVPEILIASGIVATTGLMRLWMACHLI